MQAIGDNGRHSRNGGKECTESTACLLPRSTHFGRFVTPLYEELTGISTSMSLDSFEGLKKAADALATFYKNQQVLDIQLVEDDELFLMGNEVGDRIRRVHLHAWLSENLKVTARQCGIDDRTPEGAMQDLDRIACILRRYGYSEFILHPSGLTLRQGGATLHQANSFIGADQSVVVSLEDDNFMRTVSRTDLGAKLQAVIARITEECVAKRKQIQPAYERMVAAGVNFITEPYHMWEALYLNFLALKSIPPLPDELKEGLGKVVILAVEDNPAYHHVFTPFMGLESVRWFEPQLSESSKGGNRPPIFTSCEAALERLQSALALGEEVPNVIVSDIEVGRDQLNGLAFLSQVHTLYTLYGKRDGVILASATSSHIDRYRDRIAAMTSDKVIDCGWPKIDFSAEKLARQILAASSGLA
jgi:hypothetical protein